MMAAAWPNRLLHILPEDSSLLPGYRLQVHVVDAECSAQTPALNWALGRDRVLGLAAQHLVPWRFGSSNDRRSEGSEPEPRFCSLMAFALQTRIGIRRTIASLSASPPKHAVPCHVITVVYTGRGILSQVEAS